MHKPAALGRGKANAQASSAGRHGTHGTTAITEPAYELG